MQRLILEIRPALPFILGVLGFPWAKLPSFYRITAFMDKHGQLQMVDPVFLQPMNVTDIVVHPLGYFFKAVSK